MSTLANTLAAKMAGAPAPPAAPPSPPAPASPAAPTNAAAPAAPPVTETPTPPAEPAAPAAAPAETPSPAVEEEYELNLDGDDDTPTPAPEAPAPADEESAQGAEDPEDKAVGETLSKTARGKRIYGWWKDGREVEKQLGFRPTRDQIVEFARSHSAQTKMLGDFDSGDPGRQAGVFNYFFRPDFNLAVDDNGQPIRDAEGNYVPGPTLQAARLLPRVLSQENPTAYAALAAPILEGFIRGLDKVQINPDRPNRYAAMVANGVARKIESLIPQYAEEDQVHLKKAAEIVVFALTGKFPSATGPTPSAPAPGQDPRDAEIARLKNQLRDRDTHSSRAAFEAANRDLDTFMKTTIIADITDALKAAKGKVDDYMIEAAVEKEATFILQRLSQDTEGTRLLEIRRQEAMRDPQAKQLLKREFRQRYKPILEGRYKETLRKLGVQAQQAAQSQADRARESAGRTDVQGGVQTPATHQVSRDARQPGESNEDYTKRILSMRMTSAFQAPA